MTTATQPISLDIERTRELLAQALADRGPDYVYRSLEGTGCLYWHDPRDPDHRPDQYSNPDTYDDRGAQGQPGCLVGYVLHAAGVPGTELARREQRDALTLLKELTEAGVVTADQDTRTLLLCAQTQQDEGAEWGQAIRDAEQRLAAHHVA